MFLYLSHPLHPHKKAIFFANLFFNDVVIVITVINGQMYSKLMVR